MTTTGKPPANDQPGTGAVERLAGLVAVTGGLLAVAVAILVTVSVLGRWLLAKPIDGDFEFVKMATAIAVFAYLPYAQCRRANILVDTFTGWLPPRVRSFIDAFWDVVYAAFAALCAVGLAVGAGEALKSGETTMQLQLVVWPAIAVCALLATLLVAACLITARRRVGRGG
jgi:TRAP-type C4-dicarboxylate transport system permease small subunit